MLEHIKFCRIGENLFLGITRNVNGNIGKPYLETILGKSTSEMIDLEKAREIRDILDFYIGLVEKNQLGEMDV